MVEINGSYISADQIIMVVGREGTGDNAFPYKLTVFFKNGNEFSLKFQSKAARDGEIRRIARCIDIETEQGVKELKCMMLGFRNTLDRIDKRQLRIWRQLKELLSLPEEATP